MVPTHRAHRVMAGVSQATAARFSTTARVVLLAGGGPGPTRKQAAASPRVILCGPGMPFPWASRTRVLAPATAETTKASQLEPQCFPRAPHSLPAAPALLHGPTPVGMSRGPSWPGQAAYRSLESPPRPGAVKAVLQTRVGAWPRSPCTALQRRLPDERPSANPRLFLLHPGEGAQPLWSQLSCSRSGVRQEAGRPHGWCLGALPPPVVLPSVQRP